MYLKRLEIQGFKSFPGKIRLDFREGITAIVGPNGSGKSNIADALRWVLGEQSVKSLRGGKMEDVIFSGTEERKPVGFAEVSITIDNANGRFAQEYSEIKVTRRISRMGEGEYELNGVSCRLKDIHAVFMDTGLGREGYSIVGQGRIDEIIGSRVDTRRYLFEEAAGIVKFKMRKAETEDKLAKEAANLLRVDDILAELEKQLPNLAVQAGRAREYITLRERQKHILSNLFLVDIEYADKRLADLSSAITIATEQTFSEESAHEGSEAGIDELKNDMTRIEGAIKTAERSIADNRIALEQQDNDVRLNKEQCTNFEAQISQATVRVEKEEQRRTEIEQSIAETEAKYSELETAIATKKDKLEQLETQAAEHVSEIANREQALDEQHALRLENVKLSGQIEAKVANIDGIISGLAERKNRIAEESAHADSLAAGYSEELKTTNEELRAAEEKLQAEDRLLTELELHKSTHGTQYAESSREYERASRALGEAESRHRVLSELKDSFEGYTRAVKTLMREKAKHPGIMGAVGELCMPRAGYETAIEISLGAATQNIVTTNEEAANTAIEYLKATGAGRATFLPMTAIKPQQPISQRDVRSERGVLGTAFELVTYDKQYENVFKSLLGKTLVVDSMDNAIKISRKYGQSVRIVTLTGELLSVGGAITGGSRGERSAGLFGRSREISELTSAIEKCREDVRKAQETVDEISRKIKTINDEIDRVRLSHSEHTQQRHSISENLLKLETEAESVRSRLARLAEESAALELQLDEANEHKGELENERAAADKAAKETEARIAVMQSAVQSEKDDRDEWSSELTELKVELGVHEQEQRDILADKARLERELADAATELHALQREIELNKERLAVKQEEITALAAAKGRLINYGRTITTMLEGLERDKVTKRDTLQRLEIEQKERNETLVKLQTELARLTTQYEHAETERRKLFDTMWEDYQLTPSTAKAYPMLAEPVDKLRKEERGIRSEIAQMGGVNANAIEEHQAVRERFELMSSQRADIVKAREDLLAMIAELEAMMEKQFTEQFALISDSFSVVFKQMFGGGKAYLRLLDEDNALESGIDIIAQPPGKAVSSMSLMSGGERSLTALALLFGILRLKPSPFVILDEVESALDEANTLRFAAFLKDVAAFDTQFIVITHRRGTMEAVDALYGVTMEERGVSKVVSVEL